jgi:hypothetical protein
VDRGDPDIVAARHALFTRSSSDECDSAECLLPLFDRVDYLQAYYPYDGASAPAVAADAEYALSNAALSSCDACFLDETTGQLTVDKGCLGETVCAQQAAADCTGCQPDLGGCPDFEPVAVGSSDSGQTLVVVTRSGVLVLERQSQSWRGSARVEDILGDVRVVAAGLSVESEAATAFLLGDDDRIYTVRVDLTPEPVIRVERAPFELAIPVEAPSAQIHAAGHEEFLLSSRSGAVLVRSTALGSVQAPVAPPDTAVEMPDLVASGYDRSQRSYGLLYSAIGQLSLQTMTHEPSTGDETQ